MYSIDQFSVSPFHKDIIETFKKSEDVPNKDIVKVGNI